VDSDISGARFDLIPAMAGALMLNRQCMFRGLAVVGNVVQVAA
jgi:hypothetical protein